MKKRLSDLFLVISVGLILTAGCLFLGDEQHERTAQADTAQALAVVKAELDKVQLAPEMPILPTETTEEPPETEVLVEDVLYFAVLDIPVLGLELPIQTTWSYAQLQSTPCLYKEEPMSIAAHNYRSHFGRLPELQAGDYATMTYMTGDVEEFEVVLVEKVYETEVEALQDDAYDLTLFTCNVSNNTERYLVRLNEI